MTILPPFLATIIHLCDNPNRLLNGWENTLALSPPLEGTEKLKPTIKLKVDDGEIAVLPFIICLF